MHALAQIMATLPRMGWGPMPPGESPEQKKDRLASRAEYVIRHDPYYEPSPVSTCTFTSPCQNVNCESCVDIHREVERVGREVEVFFDSNEGRFEAWCAKTAREASGDSSQGQPVAPENQMFYQPGDEGYPSTKPPSSNTSDEGLSGLA